MSAKIIETLMLDKEYYFVNDIVKITVLDKEKNKENISLIGRIIELNKDYGLVKNSAIELDTSFEFNQNSVVIPLQRIVSIEKIR
jgi:hypothetical protein